MNAPSTQRALVITLAVVLAACSPGDKVSAPVDTPPGFTGSNACAACHQREHDEWQGSHHQLAMQVADPQSVLGDFSGVTVPYFDTSATFTQREGRYFVVTEDADGEQQQFEVTHTFGVAPLQQFLVDAPGGRKQALQFAWDTRPEASGGQRWFHLYPYEHLDHDDPLHWTGPYFNWNFMCAECHSTDLQLGYDIESNTFDTTFAEISVGCEACHGPGSRHIAQAESDSFDSQHGLPVNLDDRNGAAWIMNAGTGIAERSVPPAAQQEVETCGRCHARRSQITTTYDYGRPLTDTHLPSLLDAGLYHADGRILDEVYVYGSFLQSKMYSAGVTCSDCHNPHSGQLRAGPDPNNTCASCHLPAQFAAVEHAGEPAGDCVTCHMPATTYMGVDDRRDHSFRLPNTEDDPAHYGTAIAAGRIGNANEILLQNIANESVPPIARATQLSLLEPIDTPAGQQTLLDQLDSPEPLIRIGALRALRRQSPELRLRHGSHLLRDPIRSVRIEAAVTYADEHDMLPLEDARTFPAALEELRQAMRTSASMPEAALRLAELEARLGNTGTAAGLYEHAMRIGDTLATVQHAFGLHLVRAGRPADALLHLERAAELDSSIPQFTYVYAVGLNSLGRTEEALGVLLDARERFPEHFDTGFALATIYRDAGNRDAARAVAVRLKEQHPDNTQAAALVDALAN